MTFTFTIDAFPAYTKFNKTKKVMAALQIIEPSATSHNYADKDILGQGGRAADTDVDAWYSKSVFTAEAGE